MRFYVEVKRNEEEKVLVIDRISGHLSFCTPGQVHRTERSRSIVGILGSIRLVNQRYLVVITESCNEGQINGHDIWRITGTELVSYKFDSLNETSLSCYVPSDDRIYVSMIRQVLNTPHFYFSYTYDLTHTYQRLQDLKQSPDFLKVNNLKLSIHLM